MNSIQQVLLSVVAEKEKWKNEVLAASGLIHPVDLQELSDWFSEEIPYAAFRSDTTNLFFHPLPSGNFTLGRMIPRYGESLSRISNPSPDSLPSSLHPLRKQQIFPKRQAFHVHYFIFTPELLLQYANNPISIYQRIYAHRKLPFFRKAPPILEPIELLSPKEPTPLVNTPILDCITSNPGAKVVATLLQTIFDSVSTFFTGGPPTIRLIYSLFNLLPLSWRPELTFSTEFHFSHLRPFKVIGVSSGLDLYRLNSRDQSISFCDLAAMKRSEQKSITLLDSWPLLIFHALLKKDYALLNRVYEAASEQETRFRSEVCPPGTNPEELRFLANRFLKEVLQPRENSDSRQFFEVRPFFSSMNLANSAQSNCGQNEKKEKVKIENEEDSNVFADNETAHTNHVNCVDLNNKNTGDKIENKSEDKTESAIEETVFFTDDFFPSDSEENPFETYFTPSSGAESEPSAMIKVVRLNSNSTSHSLAQRLRKFPFIQEQIKWLDACTTRILLGDSSSVDSFRNCWKEVCKQVQPLQKLELIEEYLLVVRDFINLPINKESERSLIERDINILEILDILLTS